jgi:hypothetical protein
MSVPPTNFVRIRAKDLEVGMIILGLKNPRRVVTITPEPNGGFTVFVLDRSYASQMHYGAEEIVEVRR